MWHNGVEYGFPAMSSKGKPAHEVPKQGITSRVINA